MEGFTQTIYNKIINNSLWPSVVEFEYDKSAIVGTAAIGTAIVGRKE